MKAKQKYIVSSVDRSIEILELLSSFKEGLSLTDISKRLEIPRSTTFEILATLENRHFIQRSKSTGQYKIGLKAFEIGSAYANNLDLRQEALPHLEDLAYKTKETCHLAILDDWEVVYIDKIESSHFVRLASRVGVRLPGYSTALGKVLLSYQSEESIEQFLAEVPMIKHTPNTINSPKHLKSHLEQVCAQGYAIDNEEQTLGVRCIAAPIFDYNGRAVAAISISGPVTRITEERQTELVEMAKKTATDISINLGWDGIVKVRR